MIDVCFVTTPIPELADDRLEAPLGYLYMGSYLKGKGIQVQIYDICSIPEEQWRFPEAKFYGFSTYSTTYHRTVAIKNKIKKQYPNAKFVAGGAHATVLPKEVIKDFDFVVCGEGEILIYEIVTGHLPQGIYNPDNSKILDLDKLPFPDYDLVDVHSYRRVVAGKHSFSILTSRGCPNSCAFCNSIIMGGRQRVRFRSPQNVIDEVISLKNKYGDIGIRFQDDLFGSKREWLKEFTPLMKSLNMTYRAFVRANQCCDKEFIDLLWQGGCRHISLGIESGSDKILTRMMKGQTVDHSRRGLKNAKEAGLITRIYLIVGFPGETWETVQETIDFIKEIKPDEFVVYPLIPYPGTPVWRDKEKYGLQNIDQDFTKYFQISFNNTGFVYDLDYADRNELSMMKSKLESELIKAHSIWAIDSRGYA